MITILQNKAVTDCVLLEASDGSEVAAFLKCHINGDTLTVTEIGGELFLTDGLMRAALNLGSHAGAVQCVIRPQSTEVQNELVRRGFVQNGNNSIPDIEDFFTNHKNCKKL